MLDINLFREEKGNNPEIIRESQRRRFENVEIVDEIIQLDKEWRQCQFEVKQAQAIFKNKNIQVAARCEIDVETSSAMSREPQEYIIAKKAAEVKAACVALCSKWELVGNLVHDSVRVINNEASKDVIRTWGKKSTDPNLKDDVQLLKLLGIADFEKGTKMAGEGSFFFIDHGLDLEQALVEFGIDFLKRRGFKKLEGLPCIRKDINGYCVDKATAGGDERHLIITAEIPLCAYHVHDCIRPTTLPLRYVGQTTCIRPCGDRMFIDPQFEKVQQMGITSPYGNASWDMLEDMITNSEEFYRLLKLPYRVVSTVSGSLDAAAAKTYELEAWFPASNTYRNLLSCSNFTDYHSRNLDIRFGQEEDNQEATLQYCHLLNSTLTPTQLTIRCILENYQRENGVKVPAVLRMYMRGKEFLPFQSCSVEEN